MTFIMNASASGAIASVVPFLGSQPNHAVVILGCSLIGMLSVTIRIQ